MPRTPHYRLAILPLMLALTLGAPASSETLPPSGLLQSPSASPRPSLRLDVGELAELPADTLAAWVAELTWLVEDLQAGQRLASVAHVAEVDSLTRRLDLERLRAAYASDSRPSVIEVWGLPVAVALVAAVSVWVGATAAGD